MFNRLLRQVFGNSDAARDVQLADLLADAKQHLEQGRFREAEQAADKLLARRSGHGEALYIRGTALLNTGQLAEARGDLEQARRASPSEPRYVFNLALAEHQSGNLDRARSLCIEATNRHRFGPAYHLLSAMDLGGELYYDVLKRFVEKLQPRTYLEIGVMQGNSLLPIPPSVRALGVDPAPQLKQPPGPNQKVFELTSDAFFETVDVLSELGGLPIDLAFIDGMHRFEFALRDFINIERLSHPGTVVLIHDCYPMDEPTASRKQNTAFWSGDIWRLILILKKYRPDLVVRTLKSPPTGLGMVVNLDAASTVLSDRLDEIVSEFMTTNYRVLDGRKAELLDAVPDDWTTVESLLALRNGGAVAAR